MGKIILLAFSVLVLAGCTGTCKGAKELGKGVASDATNIAGVAVYAVDKTDKWVKENLW
ncbi:MAG: hypothetical protein HQL25_07830 [Candidatus Omnitrophica bacterium]|nr:hypothetical protein [Candidatus Omnitrophota bacterium]